MSTFQADDSQPSPPDSGQADTERWNQRYATSDDYLFGTTPNAFLAAQAHRLSPGMRALAVADGEGRNGVWLARQGLEVVSFDASAVGLAKARRLADAHAVALTTVLSDTASFDWTPQSYDLVVAIFVQFAAPPLRQHMFASMQQALRPGGLLILQGYRPEQLGYGTGGPSAIENFYTADLLRSAFPAMDIEHLHVHDSELSEGQGHRGMSALIDLVARKR